MRSKTSSLRLPMTDSSFIQQALPYLTIIQYLLQTSLDRSLCCDCLWVLSRISLKTIWISEKLSTKTLRSNLSKLEDSITPIQCLVLASMDTRSLPWTQKEVSKNTRQYSQKKRKGSSAILRPSFEILKYIKHSWRECRSTTEAIMEVWKELLIMISVLSTLNLA